MRIISIAIAVFLAVLVTGVGYLWAFNPPTQAPPGGNGAIAVDNANKVGIGTTTPAEELEVAGDIRLSGTNKKIDWFAGAVQRATFDDQGTQFVFGSVTNIPVNFIQNNGSAIYVDTVKKVGIGTTSPGQLLDVNGASRFRNTMGFGAADEIGLISWGGMGGGTGFGIRSGTGRALSLGADNVWDKLVVDTSGNIGIGTTGPGAKLHIGGSNQEIRFDYNGTNNYYGSLRWAGLQLGNNGENRIIVGRTAAGGQLSFYVNNTNDAANYTIAPDGILAMRISSAGNVGIGATTPGQRLDVNGASRFRNTMNFGAADEIGLISWGGMGGGTGFGMQAGTGRALSLGTGGAWDKLVIDTSGNIGIGTASPGAKLEIAGTLKVAATSTLATTTITRLCIGGDCRTGWPGQIGSTFGGAYSWSDRDGGCFRGNPITGACSCPAYAPLAGIFANDLDLYSSTSNRVSLYFCYGGSF